MTTYKPDVSPDHEPARELVEVIGCWFSEYGYTKSSEVDYCLECNPEIVTTLAKARAEQRKADGNHAQYLVRLRFSGTYAETVAQEIGDAIREQKDFP